MNTKVTLTVDTKVLEAAEKYFIENGLSLSKVVEDYLKKLIPLKPKNRKGSIMELRGILGSAPKDFDYREERYKYLMEKYK
jgi:Family of unknown function (DUF6364)